jgi:hypothetical protein
VTAEQLVGGRGEFGLVVDNPIPTVRIRGSDVCLSRRKFQGKPSNLFVSDPLLRPSLREVSTCMNCFKRGRNWGGSLYVHTIEKNRKRRPRGSHFGWTDELFLI